MMNPDGLFGKRCDQVPFVVAADSLARVGGRYSDEWHRVHFNQPRDVVPESNMPAYSWLQHAALDGKDMPLKLTALRTLTGLSTETPPAPPVVEAKTAATVSAVVDAFEQPCPTCGSTATRPSGCPAPST